MNWNMNLCYCLQWNVNCFEYSNWIVFKEKRKNSFYYFLSVFLEEPKRKALLKPSHSFYHVLLDPCDRKLPSKNVVPGSWSTCARRQASGGLRVENWAPFMELAFFFPDPQKFLWSTQIKSNIKVQCKVLYYIAM